jgi:hypothetical protein
VDEYSDPVSLEASFGGVCEDPLVVGGAVAVFMVFCGDRSAGVKSVVASGFLLVVGYVGFLEC